jgi:peptide/nickel transport system permease protein
MLEVIRSDYVTTARAGGVPEHKILYGTALPNALIPLITGIGTGLAHSMGGALIIENVFSIPGMGVFLTTGVTNRDYPVVQSTVLFLAFVFSIMMLLVDLAYAFIDPRIKAQYERGSKKAQKKTDKNARESVTA